MRSEAIRLLGCALMLVALAGCATTSSNSRDPLEGLNRAMFSFNDALDGAIIKPVAEGYRAVLPTVVRNGVTNFFANLQDPWIAVNNALQGKITEAVQDVMRFVVNSVFGLVGFIDIASDMNLQKHDEDFGQTLGKWGIDSGPYLVLPVLGPSSLRDSVGLVADWNRSPLLRGSKVAVRNSAVAVQAISQRANILETSSLMEEAALDKYTFIRDAFFQFRRSQIYDGNAPPLEPDAQIEPDDSGSKLVLLPLQRHEGARAMLGSDANAGLPAFPVVAAQESPALESGAETGPAPAPMIFTVFADGVALVTPNAAPNAAPDPATAVVLFSDNVILQTRQP